MAPTYTDIQAPLPPPVDCFSLLQASNLVQGSLQPQNKPSHCSCLQRVHPPSTSSAIMTSVSSVSDDTQDATPSRDCIPLANATTFCCCTRENSRIFAFVTLPPLPEILQSHCNRHFRNQIFYQPTHTHAHSVSTLYRKADF